VVINNAPTGADATALRLQLPARGMARLVPEAAVETSAERDLEPVDLPAVSATGLLVAQVPAQSITTFALRAAGAA
jgi:hypothetical protein